jgi:hypothetical protein
MSGVKVQFSGDATKWAANVDAALRREFDDPQFWGHVETALEYTAGEGFQILSAELHLAGVGGPVEGGPFPAPEVRDYRAKVRAILKRIGAPIA